MWAGGRPAQDEDPPNEHQRRRLALFACPCLGWGVWLYWLRFVRGGGVMVESPSARSGEGHRQFYRNVDAIVDLLPSLFDRVAEKLV